MHNIFKKEVNLVRILIILLILTVGIYLIGIIWQVASIFSDIIVMLIAAWLLSFILEPLIKKINLLTKLPKVIVTSLVYLFLLAFLSAVIFLFLPAVSTQIKSLSEILPKYLADSPPIFHRWMDTFVASLSNSLSLIPSVAQFFLSVFITLVLSFYFIVDKERINKELIYLTPKKWRDELVFAQNAVNNAFASFLRVQVISGVIFGVITWITLRVLNIDFAASIALISGIFAAIPFIGPVLAIIPPALIAFIIDPAKALIVLVVLLIVQQFIFNVLGPKLLGHAFKLHPVIVLISFLVGLKIAGGIGAFLAIPVLGFLTVVVREISHEFSKT